jgi:hypothetical protein
MGSKKKKVFCFDLDNVICKTIKNYYHKSTPVRETIYIVNKLYDEGNIIKIYTARFMGRSNENVKKATQKSYNLTKRQLKKWKVKYNYLICGKPSFDVIIDDKSFNFKKDWHSSFKRKYFSPDDYINN